MKQYSRKQLLTANPACIYCGAPATTIDHCPPRCCFENRNWPEGYEFAACASCNAGASSDELVIGVLSRMRLSNPVPGSLPADEMKALIRGLKNNRPEIVSEMTSSTAVEQKRAFRRIFGAYGDHLRHQRWGAATFGPEVRGVISRFSVKLAQALYYCHVGRVFDGKIVVQHNSRLLDARTFFNNLSQSMPTEAEPTRGRKSLKDQFSYNYNYNAQYGVFIGLAEFNPQMVLTLMAISSDLIQRDNLFSDFLHESQNKNQTVVTIPRHTVT